MRGIYCAVFLILSFVFCCSAQQVNTTKSSNKASSFGLKTLTGKLAPIYPGFPQAKLSWSAELEYQRPTNGQKLWHEVMNYPEIGFSTVITDYGNNKVLGQSIAFYPHLTFTNHTKFKLPYSFKTGLGIAYFNNPFDEVNNINNFVIGSKLTSIVANQLFISIPTKGQYEISTGLFFYHFSNGHLKVPNVGANIIGVLLGINLLNNKQLPVDTENHPKEFDKKLRFGFSAGVGLHEVEGGIKSTGGSKYPVYSSTLYVTNKIKRLSKLGTGIELNYHTLYHDHIINHQVYKKYEKLKASALIYFVSYEFIMRRMALLWQGGINIYNPFSIEANRIGLTARNPSQLYTANKFGFRYYIKPQDNSFLIPSTYFGFNIKSQGLVAHYVQLQLGYLF